MKQTEGEWDTSIFDDTERQECLALKDIVVADTYCSWLTKETNEANAHRIVTAVNAFDDMYEALKAITEQFKRIDKLYSKDLDVIDKAEQALSKAEVNDGL